MPNSGAGLLWQAKEATRSVRSGREQASGRGEPRTLAGFRSRSTVFHASDLCKSTHGFGDWAPASGGGPSSVGVALGCLRPVPWLSRVFRLGYLGLRSFCFRSPGGVSHHVFPTLRFLRNPRLANPCKSAPRRFVEMMPFAFW